MASTLEGSFLNAYTVSRVSIISLPHHTSCSLSVCVTREARVCWTKLHTVSPKERETTVSEQMDSVSAKFMACIDRRVEMSEGGSLKEKRVERPRAGSQTGCRQN